MPHSTWPLGFGLLDIGVPAIGALVVVGLVVGVILLVVASLKKKPEDMEYSEQD